MRKTIWWMVLLASCCAAGTASGEGNPDARLQEAEAAHQQVAKLWTAGKHAEAIAQAEKALALREAALGDKHPAVAVSLNLLGIVHLAQKNHAQTEPLFQRAVTILEEALGKDHLYVAEPLYNLATLYQAQRQYGRAAPLHQRALAIREKALGKALGSTTSRSST